MKNIFLVPNTKKDKDYKVTIAVTKKLVSMDLCVYMLESYADSGIKTCVYTTDVPDFAELVLVIGGDGSYRGARDLSLNGIPCIGIPGTIDNDISSTEYTIGYDTAMNTAMEMVDRLRDTTQSHDRCSIVEVMGRHAGYLAMQTGIACGATSIIVPEVEYDINKIVAKMKRIQQTGKKHFIIVVAEGVGGVDKLAQQIEEMTGIESRATVLGHVQRGGAPTARDRVMASQMAHEAVELLEKGIGNRVICLSEGKLIDRDIYEALAMPRTFNTEEYKMATSISI